MIVPITPRHRCRTAFCTDSRCDVQSLSIAAIVSKILNVVLRWQPKDPIVAISLDDWEEFRAEPPELEANPGRRSQQPGKRMRLEVV